MIPPRGRRATEQRTVAAMVRLFCRQRHRPPAGGLCASCQALLDYSRQRLDRCPYGDAKPACRVCPVHCYQPARREEMREVMRAAGPMMIWRHPWLALVHLWTERARRNPRRPPGRSAPTSRSMPPRRV